jgi:lysozyme
MSSFAQEYVKQNEGLKLKMYKCTAGYNTIGYGHNLDTKSISKIACDVIFADDFAEVEEALVEILGIHFSALNEYRQAVLVDLMFNVGRSGFLDFKKMIEALKKAQYGLAADELLDSKYAREDVPKRAERNAFMLRSGQNFEKLV